MAGRYTNAKPVDRCFNPITVFHYGKKFIVPCGRCSACLLDKSNEWSMRLKAEIENSPYTIFFTLTYSNKYLPRARVLWRNDLGVYWCCPVEDNIRFNSVVDVARAGFQPFYLGKDVSKEIRISRKEDCMEFSYCCKDDIKLWLKLLKQDIYEKFGIRSSFRHFVISEYGPSTRRAHYHGFIFCDSLEVSEYLLRASMYKNWSMCDKTLFDQYTHYCDSGASGYVTQYLTRPDSLPAVLRENEFRPFRLASKAPAIGYRQFRKEEIYENLFVGTLEYSKFIGRIGQRSVLVYPSKYMSRLFPKCFEFSLLSFDRLLSVYGRLYRLKAIRPVTSVAILCDGLREALRPIDYTCSKVCFDFCLEYQTTPWVYLYLLDRYYYLREMLALRKFYEWQEQNAEKRFAIALSYSNFQELVCRSYLSYYERISLSSFCESLCLSSVFPYSFDVVDEFKRLDMCDVERDIFRREVESILDDMVKMPKINDNLGRAPHDF